MVVFCPKVKSIIMEHFGAYVFVYYLLLRAKNIWD